MAHPNIAKRDKSQNGIVPVNERKTVFLDGESFVHSSFFLLTELQINPAMI